MTDSLEGCPRALNVAAARWAGLGLPELGLPALKLHPWLTVKSVFWAVFQNTGAKF